MGGYTIQKQVFAAITTFDNIVAGDLTGLLGMGWQTIGMFELVCAPLATTAAELIKIAQPQVVQRHSCRPYGNQVNCPRPCLALDLRDGIWMRKLRILSNQEESEFRIPCLSYHFSSVIRSIAERPSGSRFQTQHRSRQLNALYPANQLHSFGQLWYVLVDSVGQH